MLAECARYKRKSRMTKKVEKEEGEECYKLWPAHKTDHLCQSWQEVIWS